MKRRLFIAIDLPENIKEKLLSEQKKYTDLPIKWAKKDNLHITLIFIGYVQDGQIVEICQLVKKIAAHYQPFSINLNKICYGPPKIMPPRMIWVQGEKINELTSLKQDLEKSLTNSGINFASENREFHPHITLARLKQWEWQKIDPTERPEINEDISLDFEVKSVEIMESKLKRGGAEYTVLESIKL